ncbi:DUF3298 and DUF4163 domain-containing protein [Romboutsia sp. 13368]|uniref:DUF3298 and DUF4163 domain-containing protein n=1 Tax=Romboutsia sp. 13368 TaxID=2708053 RepID=UPI0025FAC313|nr:DUF3298 and DUF4163 domain-containing protein [Romboutsia sp. 13368]
MESQINHSYVSQVNICKNIDFFKYNITYPVLKLYDESVYDDIYDKQIIININNEICEDIMMFKNNVKKQAMLYKKLYTEKLSKSSYDYVKYRYEVYINNDVTYDRNNIISIVMTKYEFTGGAHGMTYLDTYNYNLLTGDRLTLGDMFKPEVDYKEVVNKFIIEEINNNPEIYFKGDEGFKGIRENQDFYIDEDGVVIYFGLYEITPYYVGIPKFKLKFDEFNKYFMYS